MRTMDFPQWMWLSCAAPCCSTRIVRTHTVCCVWCLPSAGLWCCSQGWQRFWLLTSFILWPHSHCSRSCVSRSFPGASKFLTSTFLCFSSAFPFLPAALQHFLARLSVLHYYLLCVGLMHACNMPSHFYKTYPNMIIFIFALVSSVAWFYLIDLTWSKQGNVHCLLRALRWSMDGARFAVIVKLHISVFTFLHLIQSNFLYVSISYTFRKKKETNQFFWLKSASNYTHKRYISEDSIRTWFTKQRFILRYLNPLLNCTVTYIMIKQNKTMTE